MTAIPNEVARRRPAQVATIQPGRKVINGHVVPRRKRGWTVTGVLLLLLTAALFAGLLLSMLQQHV